MVYSGSSVVFVEASYIVLNNLGKIPTIDQHPITDYNQVMYYLTANERPWYACCTNYRAGLEAKVAEKIKASKAYTEGYACGQLIGNRELNAATDAIRDRYVTNTGTDTFATTDGWIYGLQPYFEWLDLNHSDCTIWRRAIEEGYIDYMKENDPDRFKDPTTVDTTDTTSFAYTTGYNLASSTANYPYYCWYYNDAKSSDDMQTDGTTNHHYEGYLATLIDWAETNHPECTNYIQGMRDGYATIKASAYYKACINHYQSMAGCDITGRWAGVLKFETYGINMSAITNWTSETSHFTMNTLLINSYDESTGTLSYDIYTVNSSSDIINGRSVVYFTTYRNFYLDYMPSSYIPLIALIDCQGSYFHGRYTIAYMLANGTGCPAVCDNNNNYINDSTLAEYTDPIAYINAIEAKYPECSLCIKGAKEYYDTYDFYKCYISAAFTAGRTLGDTLGSGSTSALTEIYSNTATEAETISGVHNGITVTEELTYDDVYTALEDFPEYTYFKAGVQLGYSEKSGLNNTTIYSYFNYYGDWTAKIE